MKQTATYLMTPRPAGTLSPVADVRHDSWLLVRSSDENAAWRDSIE